MEAPMLQFVPMTDDVLYQQDLPGPLVPYRCGLPCRHELRAERDAPEPAPPAEPPLSG